MKLATTRSSAAARRLGLLAALLLVLTLAAPAAQAQVVPTLRLGYLGVPGSDLANGAQLAIDQINDAGGLLAANGTTYHLALITLAEPVTAELLPQALEALQAQNIVALIGPPDGAPLTAENIQLLIQAGVPVLAPVTLDPLTGLDESDVIFRLVAPEHYYSYALATYLLEDLSLTSIALVQTDVEATAALLEFSSVMTGHGVEPEHTIQLTDASTLMEHAAPLLDMEPDAVVMWGAPADAVALLKLLRDAGWTGQFAYRYADEAARAGLLTDKLGAGMLGVTSWSYGYPASSSQIFLSDYLTTFGQVPGAQSAAGYDGVWYLRGVIRAAGVRPADILDGLRGGAPQELVGGTLRPADFGDGDMIRTAMVYRLRPGGGAEVLAVSDELARLPLPTAL